jgi:hypothetical protein
MILMAIPFLAPPPLVYCSHLDEWLRFRLILVTTFFFMPISHITSNLVDFLYKNFRSAQFSSG